MGAVDICLYHNSTIASCIQRLGYKQAGPSELAELHVELNSETSLSHLHTLKLASKIIDTHTKAHGCVTCIHVARARHDADTF